MTLGQFTKDELDTVLEKFKSRNAADLDEILSEEWKARKFNNMLIRLSNTVYKQNTIEKRGKKAAFGSSKER